MLHRIITRMMESLTRRGALVEEQVAATMSENEASSCDAHAPRPLQAAAGAYAAVHAEPGRKQSSALVVPGEGQGQWPGAPCNGAGRGSRSAVKRPGARARAGLPRRKLSGTGRSGVIVGVDPHTARMTSALRRGRRHSTGRRRPRGPHRRCRVQRPSVPRARKRALELPILCGRRNDL